MVASYYFLQCVLLFTPSPLLYIFFSFSFPTWNNDIVVVIVAIIIARYGIAPLSAERFVDLFTDGGRDDFFSTDTKSGTRKLRLQHMSTAGQHALAATEAAEAGRERGGAHGGFTAVLMLSGSDEYAPLSAASAASSVGDYRAFGETMAAACGEGAVCKVIEGADHGCSTPMAAAAVVQAVLHDLAALAPSEE